MGVATFAKIASPHAKAATSLDAAGLNVLNSKNAMAKIVRKNTASIALMAKSMMWNFVTTAKSHFALAADTLLVAKIGRRLAQIA
mmetsp:Transcript_19716/g.35680  ORF Transcript_19716/g.35680 Transcript_19716/m.35680 type:complete len:85 (-) Transcript_19716:539-793(-)